MDLSCVSRQYETQEQQNPEDMLLCILVKHAPGKYHIRINMFFMIFKNKDVFHKIIVIVIQVFERNINCPRLQKHLRMGMINLT